MPQAAVIGGVVVSTRWVDGSSGGLLMNVSIGFAVAVVAVVGITPSVVGFFHAGAGAGASFIAFVFASGVLFDIDRFVILDG